MRKTFIVILISVGAVIVAFFIWQLIFRPAGTGLVPEKGLKTEGQTAGLAANPQSETPAFDYWINKLSGEIYFMSQSGEMYKISGAGKEEKVSSQIISGLNALFASPNGSKILLSFDYPKKSVFSIFDVNAKSWQPLPEGTTAAAWDPQNNNRLTYIRENGLSSRLFTLNLTNQKSQEITKINQKDLELEWVLPKEIFLKEKSSAKTIGSIWALNLEKKTFRPIVKRERGLLVKWFADAKAGIRFISLTKTALLDLIDADYNLVAPLSFVTLPQKCLIADKIYCAVPNGIPAGAVLPDDYFKRKVYFSDVIWILGSGGELQNKIVTSAPIDAVNLQLKNNRLFFINRYDNKLYSLEIQ